MALSLDKQSLKWTVAPSAQWLEAYNLWLASLSSDHTRRAYRQAFSDLERFRGNDGEPLNRADVARWMDSMRKRKLSGPTMRLRLAAISSFYKFAEGTFDGLVLSGNPAAAGDRPKINPYGKSSYLSPTEAKALLGAINRTNLQGRRDYALFLGYLFTARRNSEWRNLRWGDLINKGSRISYRWSGKGKENVLSELPRPAYDAILELLKADGRHASIKSGEYVFAPFRDPNKRDQGWDSGRPLGDREVLALLKRYGRRAGLNPANLRVHMLRHTAAMLRKEAGDDVEAICAFLGHSSIAVTQIYLHAVEGRSDQSWATVAQMLGI